MQKLHEQHLKEWVQASGVDEAIVKLNVRSLDYTDRNEIADLLGWKAYTHKTGGWWVDGVNLETGDRTIEGGQFKPDKPIAFNDQEKPRKYLGRKGPGATKPLLMAMPDAPQYWHDVEADIPQFIALVEGGKKSGAGLTCGIPTISIPGVNCGQIRGLAKQELVRFSHKNRTFVLAFDMDLHTNPNVLKALKDLGSILNGMGSIVKVALWDEQHKGLDDLLVAKGQDAVRSAIQNAMPLADWLNSHGVEESPKDEPQSDSGDRLTFYQRLVNDLYADNSWISVGEKLYQFTGTYYRHIEDPIHIRRIHNYCNNFKVRKWDKHAEDYITEYPYASPNYVSTALKWVRSAFAVSPNEVNPPGLNCTNGVVKIKWDGKTPTWQLHPHTPNDYYLYEPYAKYDTEADTTECDRALECLDAPQRDIFLKIIAASLDLRHVRKYKGRAIKALFLKGEGANGKDTLRTMTSMLFGHDGITSCTLNDFNQYDAGRKFALYKLRSTRISWSSENHSHASIDRTQSLKAVITGDKISFEGKGIDEEVSEPESILLFNCNEAPNFTGALEAIKSRFAVVSFDRIFSVSPNPARGELQADPRFRHDYEFLQEHVLPAFLNRILDALRRLMAEGIDYECTSHALEAVKEEQNHLWRFCRAVNLVEEYGSSITVREIWERLESWYQKEGVLELDSNGKKVWHEQASKYDRNVTAVNQIVARFTALFPKAKRGMSADGVCVTGLAFAPPVQQLEALPQEPTASEPAETEQLTDAMPIVNTVPIADVVPSERTEATVSPAPKTVHIASTNGHHPHSSNGHSRGEPQLVAVGAGGLIEDDWVLEDGEEEY